MGKKTFLVEAEKCTGCKLCVVACKDEHVGRAYSPWSASQPDTGQFWMDVVTLERGRIPRVRVSYLPILCQHCENAPCIKACPEGAIKTRDDGLVWIDSATCTNCGLCQEACPYDVIFLNEDSGLAQKCTGCAHRVDEGSLPRCVEVCPHEVFSFGEIEKDGATEIFHPEYQTEPRVYWRGLPKPWIAGTVIDADSDEVLTGVGVTSVDLFEAGSTTVQSDEFGDFWIRGLEKDRKYRVEIEKDGYETVLAVVTTDDDQDLGTIAMKKA